MGKRTIGQVLRDYGQHTHYCRTPDHSDAAKRIYDIYGLHRIADPIGNLGKWIAVAISDGTSDNVLYDSRIDAIRHQHHNEFYYAYIQIVPNTMSICDAEIFLSGVRKTYDARKALMDRDHPSGGMEIIPRLTVEDQQAQNAGMATNLILPVRRID
jgi:hypothetical protein